MTHVVIVGAGPSGLLCAINLLRRNQPNSPPVCTVEVVEAGEDYGLLDAGALSKKRAGQGCLAGPGMHAIRRVPGLYEYISNAAVEIDQVALYLDRHKIAADPSKKTTDNESYMIDRNDLTAALARYIHHHFADSAHLTLRYGHRLNSVDTEQRRVHVRAADGTETYLPYDLLVGADGVRSQVRAALVAQHQDFECVVEDISERFKSIHIDTPEGVESNFVHVFPRCLRNMNGMGLPATGDRINISIGHRGQQPCDEALDSTDASVVAQYFKEHFKAFPLPYREVAKAWVKMEWQSSTTTRCNYYHSDTHQIVIMGDAAHATATSIGLGMNHALADAAALDELLSAHGNNFSSVLSMYSSLRVKEGHTLTDMAALTQKYNSATSRRWTLLQLGRTNELKMMPSVEAAIEESDWQRQSSSASKQSKSSSASKSSNSSKKAYAELQRLAAIKERELEVAPFSRPFECWY